MGFLKNAVFGFVCEANVGFPMALVEAKSPTPSSGVNVDVLCAVSVSCPVLSIKCPSSVAQRGLSSDLGLGGDLRCPGGGAQPGDQPRIAGGCWMLPTSPPPFSFSVRWLKLRMELQRGKEKKNKPKIPPCN